MVRTIDGGRWVDVVFDCFEGLRCQYATKGAQRDKRSLSGKDSGHAKMKESVVFHDALVERGLDCQVTTALRSKVIEVIEQFS